MDSYLHKTADVSLFDNTEPKQIVQIRQAANESEATEVLERDGVVRICSILNINELAAISEYVRSAMYKGDLTNTVVYNQHQNTRHIIFHPGRQDTWNIDLPLSLPLFIKSILDSCIHADYKKSSTGALTLDANTLHTGKWHRDTMPLFNLGSIMDSDLHTRDLPNFYFTLFIPLSKCDVQSGATEMMIGSHKAACDTGAYAVCDVGDIIIMNGKLIHRSKPNNTDKNRDLLYIIYCAKWYDEEEF